MTPQKVAPEDALNNTDLYSARKKCVLVEKCDLNNGKKNTENVRDMSSVNFVTSNNQNQLAEPCRNFEYITNMQDSLYQKKSTKNICVKVGYDHDHSLHSENNRRDKLNMSRKLRTETNGKVSLVSSVSKSFTSGSSQANKSDQTRKSSGRNNKYHSKSSKLFKIDSSLKLPRQRDSSTSNSKCSSLDFYVDR